MRLPALLLPLGLLLALPLVAGCDSDGGTNPPTAQTYVGTFAGGASGALSVTVEGSTATGTFTTANKTARPELSGSYTASTGALTLSGGGYAFTGTLSGNTLSGTWTGPNGTSGSFTTSLSGTGTDAVTVYCGTFDGNVEDGTLNIVVRGAGLVGIAVGTDGDATELGGSVSGNAVSVWVAANPSAVVATGTISGTSLTGTFSGGSNTGVWQASVCTP